VDAFVPNGPDCPDETEQINASKHKTAKAPQGRLRCFVLWLIVPLWQKHLDPPLDPSTIFSKPEIANLELRGNGQQEQEKPHPSSTESTSMVLELE